MDFILLFILYVQVRVSSDELDRHIKNEIVAFRDALRSGDVNGSGQIALEFYQRKRPRWPFPAECIPWEVWTIKVDCISLANEHGMWIVRKMWYMLKVAGIILVVFSSWFLEVLNSSTATLFITPCSLVCIVSVLHVYCMCRQSASWYVRRWVRSWQRRSCTSQKPWTATSTRPRCPTSQN